MLRSVVKFWHFKRVFLGKAAVWQKAEENLILMINEKNQQAKLFSYVPLKSQTPREAIENWKYICFFGEREEKTEKELCLQ